MAMASVAERLAAFAKSPVKGDQAAQIMRLSLLDWAAVGLAGADEPVSQAVRMQALEDAGRTEATMIGHEQRVPSRVAAWVNGTTSHALDYDDTHFAHIGHPSVAVVPAVLAAAERVGASMAAFQDAALVGAEASVRVGVWLGRGHYQVGFHQTATAGAFGATLAAGRLLGLSQDQMIMALGLVATRASGLKSQFGSMGKPLNAGFAAQSGIEAALLAEKGVVSTSEGMEGAQGFGPTHHGASDDAAWEGLGENWLFETVQYKFHACCHGLHAALEALAKRSKPSAELESATVYTHPRWMTVCNISDPQTGLEAKFSYRLVLAMALAGRDTARLDSFTQAVCRDAQVVDFRDRVRVEADDSLGEMHARLVLTTRDGSKEVLFHDLAAPVAMPEKTGKVRAKAASLVGEKRADQIWTALSEHTEITEFTGLLVSAQR
jgi:2-methylcitrate dehydratase PrpD